MIYEIRDLIDSMSELEDEIEDYRAELEAKFGPEPWEIHRLARLQRKAVKREVKLIKKMKKYIKENKIHVEVYPTGD